MSQKLKTEAKINPVLFEYFASNEACVVHLEINGVPGNDRLSLTVSQFTRLLGLAQRVVRSSTSTNILRRDLRESICAIERVGRASGVSLAHILLAAAELEHTVKSAGALQVLRLITVLHVDFTD